MVMLLVSCAAAGPPEGLRSAPYAIPRDGAGPLLVRATWPDGEGTLPIVVFSHGMGGSRDGYAPLVHAWAAAGYLVLQPTHPDTLSDDTVRERVSAMRDRGAFVRDPENLGSWDERPVEVSLVLDHLDALTPLGLDPARVDREHVGIGGHSFGAHTSMLAGGLAGAAYDEPRADALMLLSPPGPGPGTPATGYAAIHVPTLVVTGSQDVSPADPGLGPDWRLEVWDGLTGAPRWLLFVEGADHGLGGIGGGPRARTEPGAIFARVSEATTAFWDATLRGDAPAQQRLDATLVARRPSADGPR